MNKSILMYARDRELVETRTWVLEARGYHVFTASNLSGNPSASDIKTL